MYFCISSVGRRKKPPEVGLRAKYYTPRQNPENPGISQDSLHGLTEPLELPPTKLEEKRTKLFRLYERKQKKRIAAQVEKAQKNQASLGHVDEKGKGVTS